MREVFSFGEELRGERGDAAGRANVQLEPRRGRRAVDADDANVHRRPRRRGNNHLGRRLPGTRIIAVAVAVAVGVRVRRRAETRLRRHPPREQSSRGGVEPIPDALSLVAVARAVGARLAQSREMRGLERRRRASRTGGGGIGGGGIGGGDTFAPTSASLAFAPTSASLAFAPTSASLASRRHRFETHERPPLALLARSPRRRGNRGDAIALRHTQTVASRGG